MLLTSQEENRRTAKENNTVPPTEGGAVVTPPASSPDASSKSTVTNAKGQMESKLGNVDLKTMPDRGDVMGGLDKKNDKLMIPSLTTGKLQKLKIPIKKKGSKYVSRLKKRYSAS